MLECKKIFGSGNVLNRKKNVFQYFKVRWSAGWDVQEAILDITEALLDVAEVILYLSENNATLWPPYGALLGAECGNKAEWSQCVSHVFLPLVSWSHFKGWGTHRQVGTRDQGPWGLQGGGNLRTKQACWRSKRVRQEFWAHSNFFKYFPATPSDKVCVTC